MAKVTAKQISPYWDDAHYECSNCDKKDISEDELKVKRGKITWRCPSCDEPLYVYASTNDWNYCLIRKFVYELEETDLVLMYSPLRNCKVLSLDDNNGIVRVALKGHGVVNLDENDWVDCINGTWDSNTTPWK